MLLVCLDIKFTSVIQDIFIQNLGVKVEKKKSVNLNRVKKEEAKEKFDAEGNEITKTKLKMTKKEAAKVDQYNNEKRLR
jgi:hypothetical protein